MNESTPKTAPGKAGKTPAAAPAAATNPWQSLADMRHEMDRMFEGLSTRLPSIFTSEPFSMFTTASGKLTPVVDIVENKKKYTVTAEVPGLSDKDLEISVAGDMLTIRGEKQEQKEEKTEDYRLSERRYGSVLRSFRLPADVDADKIEASCDKGVVTVTLPKQANAQPKQWTAPLNRIQTES